MTIDMDLWNTNKNTKLHSWLQVLPYELLLICQIGRSINTDQTLRSSLLATTPPNQLARKYKGKVKSERVRRNANPQSRNAQTLPTLHVSQCMHQTLHLSPNFPRSTIYHLFMVHNHKPTNKTKKKHFKKPKATCLTFETLPSTRDLPRD